MADTKISALIGATTPLAGTEILPIVQGGSTKQVSVANLTAGRAVGSAGGTFTDNYVQGVAAKGVNFSANTPAAGMTSQLLNWYEEGTWTPTSFDITYAAASGTYTRIGRQVFLHFSITLPTTTDVNNITIVGFPFTVANSDTMRSGAIGYTDYATACTVSPVKNATRGNIFTFGGTAVTNVAATGKTFAGVFIYNV